MATANEQLQSALLKRQSYIQLLSKRFGIDFKANLDGSNRDIKGLIADELPKISSGLNTAKTAGRMASIGTQYRKIREPIYKAYESEYTKAMARLANDEAEFIAKSMQHAIPFDVALSTPAPTAISNLTAFAAYNGQAIPRWFSDMKLSDYTKFESTVRASVNQGLNIDQTINQVVGKYYKTTDKYTGSIQGTRYSAERLTRTITNGVSNGSQQEFYKANADIIAYEVYSAVLDGRTSMICAGLDGTKFKVGEGEVPPLHPNCRSSRVPVIDGIGLIGNKPSVGGTNFREDARKKFIGNKTAKGMSKKEAQRKWNNTSNSYKNSLLNKERRAYGKNVIGSQPADTTYSSWLKKQDAGFQADVLGKTNASKFRSGEMTLDKFTDKLGKPLTLDELASKYPEIYE